MKRSKVQRPVVLGGALFVLMLALAGEAQLRPLKITIPKKQSDPAAPYYAFRQLSVQLARHPRTQNFIVYALPDGTHQHDSSRDDAIISYSRYTQKLTWSEHDMSGESSDNTWEIEDADIPLAAYAHFSAQDPKVNLRRTLSLFGRSTQVAPEDNVIECGFGARSSYEPKTE